MTWIKRGNWSKPNLPDSAFVEIKGLVDESTAGMMMIWWEKFGIKEFTVWLDEVESGEYGDKE